MWAKIGVRRYKKLTKSAAGCYKKWKAGFKNVKPQNYSSSLSSEF
jgi:hypothetical protein